MIDDTLAIDNKLNTNTGGLDFLTLKFVRIFPTPCTAKITFIKQECAEGEVCETTSLEIGKVVRVLIDYGRSLDPKYKLSITKERFKLELISYIFAYY